MNRGDHQAHGDADIDQQGFRELQAGLDGFRHGVGGAQVVQPPGVARVPGPGDDDQIRTQLSRLGDHRLGGLESVPALLEKRPPLEVWFGNGFGSAGQLYDRHLMHQIYMRTVDNMLVYALGTMGIVGLGALLALSVVTAALADRTGRAILAMVFAMYFSFDLWTWFNIGAFTCMFMAMPRPDRTVDGLVISRQALVSATPRMRS